uniref:Uncharacterized protein n=1 Tax=Romanomermis culicivorax TaxID=13658 RepID=A0A915IKY7_ROMCU
MSLETTPKKTRKLSKYEIKSFLTQKLQTNLEKKYVKHRVLKIYPCPDLLPTGQSRKCRTSKGENDRLCLSKCETETATLEIWPGGNLRKPCIVSRLINGKSLE